MSRAEPRGYPPRPRIGRALRDAAVDLYYHSLAFVIANVVLGALLAAIVYLALLFPPAALLLAMAVLPAAGMMRMAARLHRDLHTDLGDALEVLRAPMPFLAMGAAQVAISAVLVVDVVVALAWGSWAGTVLIVGAAYGLVALWVFSVVAWPLLLDPVRDSMSVRSRLHLAAHILVREPMRLGLLAGLLAGGLLVAGILIVPLGTFAVAAAWLASVRYVLPLADLIEGRPTAELDSAG